MRKFIYGFVALLATIGIAFAANNFLIQQPNGQWAIVKSLDDGTGAQQQNVMSSGQYNASGVSLSNLQTAPLQLDPLGSVRTVLFSFGGNTPASIDVSNGLYTVPTPTASAALGIAPVASGAAAASLVLKASAGNFYGGAAVNTTATAGFCLIINATAAPSSGTAVTPLLFAVLPANGQCSITPPGGIMPAAFSTGIVFLVSSNASPYTFTSGVITAAISGMAK